MSHGGGRVTVVGGKVRLNRALRRLGVDPARAIRRRRERTIYARNREAFVAQLRQNADNEFPLGENFPCLDDRGDQAGTAGGHYFHQDIWVARRILEASPRRHVDVGSRVDGFVAHVAVFREIEVLDIRPMTTSSSNITFRQLDLMTGADELTSSTDSLSCLHALEHFGLGRYGDPIDADGWRTGLGHLIDMLEPGGVLYLSVPIGPQRVEFDAHRVFGVGFLRDELSLHCSVDEFAYVDDAGELHTDIDVHSAEADRSFGCTYGCGIFVARRRG